MGPWGPTDEGQCSLLLTSTSAAPAALAGGLRSGQTGLTRPPSWAPASATEPVAQTGAAEDCTAGSLEPITCLQEKSLGPAHSPSGWGLRAAPQPQFLTPGVGGSVGACPRAAGWDTGRACHMESWGPHVTCPRHGEPGPRRGGTETPDATVTAPRITQVRLCQSRGRPRGSGDPGMQLRLLVALLHPQEALPHAGL